MKVGIDPYLQDSGVSATCAMLGNHRAAPSGVGQQALGGDAAVWPERTFGCLSFGALGIVLQVSESERIELINRITGHCLLSG
jgi:hypothetical protein